MTPTSAAIVTIGTEITSGEIINSNAAWLSQRLTHLGFEVLAHLTVPDERTLIQRTLLEATAVAQLIIVTGGLGPTSDDFTREELAKFAGRKLIWDDASWSRVVARLEAVRAPIAESNRQQCWYPEDAVVLPNAQGTASAFRFKTNTHEFIALPGPPREIDAVWQDHLQTYLRERIPAAQRTVLKKWTCLGLSESKLGELVESVLKGGGFTTGYRARIPYIDVKVWVAQKDDQTFETSWRPRLEAALSSWIISRDGEDVADRAAHAMARFKDADISIADHATGGRLASRLLNSETPCAHISVTTTITGTKQHNAATIVLQVDVETGTWTMQETTGQKRQFQETARYRGRAFLERLQMHICERSLIQLAEWFR